MLVDIFDSFLPLKSSFLILEIFDPTFVDFIYTLYM
jgi:lysine/ornithine N-monooxygenase